MNIETLRDLLIFIMKSGEPAVIFNSMGYESSSSIKINKEGTQIYSVQKDFIAIKSPGPGSTTFRILPFSNILWIMSGQDFLKGQ